MTADWLKILNIQRYSDWLEQGPPRPPCSAKGQGTMLAAAWQQLCTCAILVDRNEFTICFYHGTPFLRNGLTTALSSCLSLSPANLRKFSKISNFGVRVPLVRIPSAEKKSQPENGVHVRGTVSRLPSPVSSNPEAVGLTYNYRPFTRIRRTDWFCGTIEHAQLS